MVVVRNVVTNEVICAEPQGVCTGVVVLPIDVKTERFLRYVRRLLWPGHVLQHVVCFHNPPGVKRFGMKVLVVHIENRNWNDRGICFRCSSSRRKGFRVGDFKRAKACVVQGEKMTLHLSLTVRF